MTDMLTQIRALGDQLRWAAQVSPPSVGTHSDVLFAGMGGSGIAGDYASAVATPFGTRVSVHKGYRPLPPWTLRHRPLVIAASYSGNTEETLDVASAAFEKGLPVAVITTGGALGEQARRRNWPMIEVPAGYQPRAAAGFMIGAALRLLEGARALDEQVFHLREAATVADEALAEGSARWEEARSIAEQLAGRITIVYGGGPVSSVAAQRWKTQINENAKMPAWWSTLPELDHNEIVGWETLKEGWPEYEALMVALSELPPGRVMWEANNDGWNRYGTPMSGMLIPYWTEGSHKSMEGLFFESSITTPFHFINHSEMSFAPSNPIPGLRYHTFDMERGLRHMDVYGVEYYVAITPEAAEKAGGIDGFELIREVPPFHIFRLPDTDLVEVATHLPAVYDVPERGLLGALIGSETVIGPDGEPLPSFHDMALEWYEDVDEMHRWVVLDGPDEWPRITSIGQRPETPITGAAGVDDIVVDHHRISFTTEAVGVPHLVKVSYFPNWQATGADGPWRATPSLMVVVPTQADVVIEFVDTWPETVGKILTVVGVLALVGAAIWDRRTRRPQD